jgi:hypothetical protein
VGVRGAGWPLCRLELRAAFSNMVPPPLLPRGGRRGLLGEEGVSPPKPLVLTAVKVLPERSLWSRR